MNRTEAKTVGRREPGAGGLRKLIESCFSGTEVVVEVSPVIDAMDNLYAAESSIVRKAVLSRKQEFSTGRFLARKATREFGVPDQALLRGERGEVLWPDSLVGSISHTKEWCAVVVAGAGDVKGIGIDIEADRFRSVDAMSLILHDSELPAFNRIDGSQRIRELLRIFSAKEAIYKAVSGRIGRYVDFKEVCIHSIDKAGDFVGSAPEDCELDELLSQGKGRGGSIDGLVVSSYIVRDWDRQ